MTDERRDDLPGSHGGGDSEVHGATSFEQGPHENARPDADTNVDPSGGTHPPTEHVSVREAQERWPDEATSERRPETPPHGDAEDLEKALREGGPLHDDYDVKEAQLRRQDTAPGGTSLT